MCTLLTLTASYLASVSAHHSIFFILNIVVGSPRYLFIYKIREFCNFSNHLCKNRDVYPSNSSWKVFGTCFCYTQNFFHTKYRGWKLTVSIYIILDFFNFRNYLCKIRDVYPSNSSWNVFGICFCYAQYFF